MSPRPFASKGEAVAVLVDVCKRERQPNGAEFRRLLRALRSLGLDLVEQREACRHLDIVKPNGRPWSSDLVSLAPWPIEGEKT